MSGRSIEAILAEWRVLERALEHSADAAERIDLERATAALADEYREAINAEGGAGPRREDLGAAT